MANKPMLALPAQVKKRGKSKVYHLTPKKDGGLALLIGFVLENAFGMKDMYSVAKAGGLSTRDIYGYIESTSRFALDQFKIEVPSEIDAALTVDTSAGDR